MPALWAFCVIGNFERLCAASIRSSKCDERDACRRCRFDVERWREVADEAGRLPEPWSDDPTQWLFEGRPEVSTAPLQVAVARLLGYRWPEQAERMISMRSRTRMGSCVCRRSRVSRRRRTGCSSVLADSVRRDVVAGEG